MKDNQSYRDGIILGLCAYVIWGILPIYWKLIDHIHAVEVLAHRIIWSFIFMMIALFLQKKLRPFWQECKQIFSNKKTALGIICAAFIISINWALYIWAVANDQIIEASLGYYINPLMSVVLAIVFLRERLSRPQVISFILALVGVVIITLYHGVVPWIPLILALSFGLYGLMKKIVNAEAMYGLTIETMIVTPFALVCLFFMPANWGISGFSAFAHMPTAIALIASGIATAVPLLLFAIAAKRMPLSVVSFLQYLAPTIMLFIGIFLYDEPFALMEFFSFLFIWTGLIIFTVSSFRTKQ